MELFMQQRFGSAAAPHRAVSAQGVRPRTAAWAAARGGAAVALRRRPGPASAAAPGAMGAADLDGREPVIGETGSEGEPGFQGPQPTPQQLAAAAQDPAAFHAALRRLSGPGGRCTEAHVVAAWAAQRHSRPLHGDAAGAQQGDALCALVLLEELTRQQVVAFTPDQLGFVFRCYVLAGGASKPLVTAFQRAACSWAGSEYSAAGLAELVWALSSCGQPLPPSCRQLLRAALQEPGGRALSRVRERQQQQQQQQQQPGQEPALAAAEEAQQAAVPPEAQQLEQQQQQQQPSLEQLEQMGAPGGLSMVQQQQAHQQRRGRDWQVWFDGTPASRIVLLLWSAAHLDCPPCERCLHAAAAALLRSRGLAALPTKSLVALLWALAMLRAAQLQPLLQAVCQQLGDRMEACLARSAASHSPTSADSTGDHSSTGPSSSSSSGSTPSLASSHGSGDGGSQAGASPADEAWGEAASPAVPRHIRTTDLCTIVWACGRLRLADLRVLGVACALLHARVDSLGPDRLSRVLWGLGQLGYCPALLLDSVAERLQQPGVLPGFSPRQLAMTTYAFAALDFFPGQECVDALADVCLAARASFEPRALSHVLWNMSRLGLVDELFYQAFVPAILPNIRQYGPAELADIARVYSRYGFNPEWSAEQDTSLPEQTESGSTADGSSSSSSGSSDGNGSGYADIGAGSGGPVTLFDALAAQTVACIQTADIQDVLRIMTAFHQMGLQPEVLLSAVEGWADQRLRRLTPQALSLALWSFARMGSGSPKLLETAAGCAERQLGAFTPQQLAQVAWALAKLRWPAPRVLRHASAQLAERGDAFGEKETSNVLWALASEGEALPAEALDRIAANLHPRLKTFGPQSLSNIAWAYATLGHTPPAPFVRLLVDGAARQLRVCEPQALSLLVWSLASLGSRPHKLFAAIAALCRERPALLRQFEGQNLSNVLWGFCRAGYRPPEDFLQQIAEEAQLRVCDLKPQEMFNTAWAFAQLEHHPQRLFDGIAREAAPRAFAFSPQELSGTLWALAKGRHSGSSMPSFLHAVELELASRESEMEDRHVAITLWSFGQLAHVPAGASLAPVLDSVLRRLPAMDHRTLTTLVTGLGDVELAWRRQQVVAAAAAAAGGLQAPGRLEHAVRQVMSVQARGPGDAAAEATQAAAAAMPAQGAVAARSAEQHAAGQAHRLLPAACADALAARAEQLLPQLQPFELSGLLRGLAALGSDAACDRFLRRPDPGAALLLQRAAERGKLPCVVELLWAMAAWQCVPTQTFAAVATRLQKVPKEYRFTQPTLVQLGEALAALAPQQRRQLGLRGGLAMAATGTARAAVRAAAAPASAADSSDDSGADEEGPTGQAWYQGHRHQNDVHGAVPVARAARLPASCSHENDERALEGSLDDFAELA